jgi:hypothetical protein
MGAVAEMGTHTWTCPACGRRVPLRVAACHCGATREQAEMQARARAEERAPRPGPRRPRATLPPLPADVKALLVASAFAIVGGLAWLVLVPSRPAPIPAVLGYMDPTPPPVVKVTPAPPRPPFKLPWWK